MMGIGEGSPGGRGSVPGGIEGISGGNGLGDGMVMICSGSGYNRARGVQRITCLRHTGWNHSPRKRELELRERARWQIAPNLTVSHDS
jgi:hypothetical protein